LAGLAAVFALAVTAAITGSPAASAGTRPASITREYDSPAVHAPTGPTLSRSLKPADSGQQGQTGFGGALVGSVPVGNGPSFLAMDPATHTIYVANGNNDDGPPAGGDTVSVIDARHCNAQDIARCKGPWPTITIGNRKPTDLPSGIAIDVKTDTVYVANVGANTVSVFNGATCNATVTTGCGQIPAEVPVGLQPITLAADPANHTVYVVNYGAPALGGPPGNSTTVSMIDSATCNATDLTGCPTTPPPTVNVKAAPDDVAVNRATHTVYVTTIGTHRAQNGWAVFDADTCNATVQSACGAIGRLIGDPIGPNAAEVDPANDTLYSANYDNTISAFDLRHCWAGDLGGCAAQQPGTVTPFPWSGFEHALYVAVDPQLHSVYVTYHKDDTLIAVDTNVCNGSQLAACATLRPPTIHTGTNPQSVILDQATQTLYTANEVDNTVSVIDATRCNAHTTAGCRHPAPAMALAAGGGAADPAVHTAYITSGSNSVAMIDTTGCNASHLSGCAATPPTVTVGTGPNAAAVDQQTHTAYVANASNGSSGSVSVINTATCNATSTAGCGHLATLQIPGGNPVGIAVNTATGTLYVATLTSTGPNLISVFNATTCNATHTTGCGQAPAVLSIGDSGGAPFASALNLAVDQATNTIYATNVVTNTKPFGGDSVYVINGATCNGTNHTGCGQTPATVTAGFNPFGIAVDQATDTIYTANIADGEHPGTVSVINGATCNGTNHADCGQTPTVAAAGFGSAGVAIDPDTDTVYVTNVQDTSVTVINGATCNGSNTTGCSQAQAKAAVGNYPGAITVDPATGTAYISNGDNTLSVIHG
jgi:DNA-binding beta-propeller fold protein YncE